ncbi:MAG: ABC transporter permease [Oscillospiraceae bacterium]|jgi:putative ABC transport system permease protein|nr:ABC transporter permease [Oscillospiraceae bacterium]
MRVTYGKNVLRTIRHTLGRFIAIFAIVALGVGFLAGLLSATPDMRDSFDRYFDESALYDIRVMGDLGLTDADIAQLRLLDGVETVQPGYIADVLMTSGKNDDYSARLHSLTISDGALNQPELRSGRLPEKDGECVLVNVPLAASTFKTGDTLEISQGDKNAAELLSTQAYAVVGFADYSPYFSAEKEYTTIGSGTVDIFLLVPESSFSTSFYTDVYIGVRGARALTSLTEAYQAPVDAVADSIERLAGKRSRPRYNTFMAEAGRELAGARADYAEAEAALNEELADARLQLDDGERGIQEGEKTLAQAWTGISEGERTLRENQNALERQERDVNTQLAEAEARLSDAQGELTDSYTAVTQTLADAQDALQGYALSEAQQTAFAGLRQLPARYPQLTAELGTLQTLSARLTQIGGRLAEIAAMAPDAQAKYAGESAALALEKDSLQAEAAAITAGEAYQAYAQGAARLATAGAADAGLPALALKLGAADAAKRALDAARTELDAGRAELDTRKATGRQQLDEAKRRISGAQAELSAARAQYFSGLSALSEKKAELEQGRQDYERAKTEAEQALADAKQALTDAEEALEEVGLPAWTVSTREENISYASIAANIDKVDAIARIFPFFFFLVAALVALTTMTRMVEDERLQIGTMKALGYSRRDIMAKYVMYALSAALLGSLVGVLVGFRLFPGVIWNAYTMMYELPRFYYPINGLYAVTTSGAVILCTLLATLNACYATLREKPAQLMLVRAPEPGKRVLLERIGFIWRRLRFTHKVTARNLFRYKKRFMMTTIGVAGCTALLVAGFGLHDSFTDIPERQFGVLQTFDIMAPLSDGDARESPALNALLSDGGNIAAHTTVSYESVTLSHGGLSLEISSFIPERASDLSGFAALMTRTGGERLTIEEGGVLITEKACELLGVRAGDTVELRTRDGLTGSFRVSGICENYLRNYVYMTGQSYESAMGRRAEQNTLLLRLTESGRASLTDVGKRILLTGAVNGISYTANARDAFSQAISKIDTIVAVVILSAGALALVVLYNLTNINISERVKEIATIKVLGFTDREVNAYVNRESMLLALVGTAFGLALGIFLHRYIVASAELSSMMFGRTIRWFSYVYSAALTLTFSLLVDLIMRRKLRHISMVESMKAPE